MSEQTLTPALQRYGEQLVTLGDQTLTLHEWCAIRKIPIISVKRRRSKCYTWSEALAPLDMHGAHLKKIVTNLHYPGAKPLTKSKKANVGEHEHTR